MLPLEPLLAARFLLQHYIHKHTLMVLKIDVIRQSMSSMKMTEVEWNSDASKHWAAVMNTHYKSQSECKP